MSNTATLVQPQTSTTTSNIEPAHTVAEFKVKHMMIANVKGHFSRVSGVLIRDESDPANDRVEATIEAASIETRNEQRDGHLKSEDFFHVEKFPTLHFKSTGIRVVDEGELSVEGDLTIRGVTRRSVLRWKDQRRLQRIPGGTLGLGSRRAPRSIARTSV